MHQTAKYGKVLLKLQHFLLYNAPSGLNGRFLFRNEKKGINFINDMASPRDLKTAVKHAH